MSSVYASSKRTSNVQEKRSLLLRRARTPQQTTGRSLIDPFRFDLLRSVLISFCFVVAILCPVVAEAELLLQFGEISRILNTEAEDLVQSGEFSFTLDGVRLNIRQIGGAARLGKGEYYVAVLLSGDVVSGFPNKGWKLLSLDVVNRTASVAMELSEPISALARSPVGQLIGVTFKPAHLVNVNLTTGTVATILNLNAPQTTIFNNSVGSAALVWLEDPGKYLWIHRNVVEYITAYQWISEDASLLSVPAMPIERYFVRPQKLLSPILPGEPFNVVGFSSITELEIDSTNGLNGLGQTPLVVRTFQGEFAAGGQLAYLPVDGEFSCSPSDTVMCLGSEDQYKVTALWTDPNDGQEKTASVRRLSADSGALWFTAASNLEILIKVLDTCSFSPHSWVFGAASTDLAYTITVEDTSFQGNGERTVEYHNFAGNPAPAITDTAAFPCP